MEVGEKEEGLSTRSSNRTSQTAVLQCSSCWFGPRWMDAVLQADFSPVQLNRNCFAVMLCMVVVLVMFDALKIGRASLLPQIPEEQAAILIGSKVPL